MDLVSSTLDKYLKHRFNGNQQHQQQTQQRSEKKNSNTTTNHSIVPNGTCGNDPEIPFIHKLSICNNQPCCVIVREDLGYVAAGFENSHIYLWSLEVNEQDEKSDIKVGICHKLIAHSGSVYGIQFIKNDDLMLSCSEDTTIRLWCLKTKCNVNVFRGHSYPIWSLDIGSQGQHFATGSMDTTARLWRLDRMTPLRMFCGHDEDVEHVKFHPNEKYLATGSSDATVRLWSISDGKMVRLMVGHEEPITSLSFLPDGKFLASASFDGVIKIWNLATNSVSSQFTVPASFTISFSPDQKFISSCGVDNVISLWQVIDGAALVERKRYDFKEKASNLIQSQFHRDNKLFVISFVKNEK